MKHYRCKCGSTRITGNLPPASCGVCRKCGSVPAEGPSLHPEPKPHCWGIKSNVMDDQIVICHHCNAVRDRPDTGEFRGFEQGVKNTIYSAGHVFMGAEECGLIPEGSTLTIKRRLAEYAKSLLLEAWK